MCGRTPDPLPAPPTASLIAAPARWSRNSVTAGDRSARRWHAMAHRDTPLALLLVLTVTGKDRAPDPWDVVTRDGRPVSLELPDLLDDHRRGEVTRFSWNSFNCSHTILRGVWSKSASFRQPTVFFSTNRRVPEARDLSNCVALCF